MRPLCLTVLLAGCLDGLPPEDPGTVAQPRGACTELEGRTFQSLQQGECGLTPGGTSSCFWHIRFTTEDGTKTRFTWGHSDVEESGFVTCDAGAIHTSQAVAEYEGSYDPADLDLVWDDRQYAAQ